MLLILPFIAGSNDEMHAGVGQIASAHAPCAAGRLFKCKGPLSCSFRHRGARGLRMPKPRNKGPGIDLM